MARDLKKEQLAPILNILRLSKEKEFREMNCTDIHAMMCQIEKENLEKTAAIEEKVKALKPLIDEINADILEVNQGKSASDRHSRLSGTALVGELSMPELTYSSIWGPNDKRVSRDSRYKITQDQSTHIYSILDERRSVIEMKYATLEAEIMLSDDFTSIKAILAKAGITLGENKVNEGTVATAKA